MSAEPPDAVQLITYPDSLGGDLAALERLLATRFRGWFPGGVHLLPPFPSSGDRGFAPIDYTRIDEAFGTWDDVARLAAHGPLTLDVMVNHVSRHSGWFADFVARGRASPWADAFITLDKVWPDGDPPAADVARIFLRKPEHPFSDVVVEDTGDLERVWTSFGPRVDHSEQVDLDLGSPVARDLIEGWFAHLAAHGTSEIRLDAVGYVVKRAGTSCFMVEPEIWDRLDDLDALAAAHGLATLPEVHDHPATRLEMARRGHRVYDFVLPGLVLHTLVSGEVEALAEHLATSPTRQVTMLDCHDGIPVRPDLDGVVDRAAAEALVAHCVQRGANVNRVLGAGPDELDAHQINITYPAACGDDERYLAARALQLFAPGRPQVYYVGLLAGGNDHAAVDATGEGRAINRHDYTLEEIDAALDRDVVARHAALLELRTAHRGFEGPLSVHVDGASVLVAERSDGLDRARLTVDAAAGTFAVETSADGGPLVPVAI